MARWSTLKEGSDLRKVEIVQTFKSNKNRRLDLDSSVKGGNVDDCKETLRSLFDQILLVFLSEVSAEKCIRPIPALLGDGQPADLLKLFWVVRERGGYDSVSRSGLWASVAEECGLDGGLIASVKLVYMKYLSEMDQWLQGAFRDKRLGSGESEVAGKLGLLLLELQSEFRDLLWDEQHVKKRDGELKELECKKNGKYIDLDRDKRELLLPAARDISEVHVNAEKNISDDDEYFIVNNEKRVVVSDMTAAKQVSTSWKRKREYVSLSGMLNWVIEVAKCPDDPAIGSVPECSKWKDNRREEFWVQVLLARKVLLRRRHVDSNTEESVLEKKLKMHPWMYENSDVLNHQSAERLRCSQRLTSLTKPRFCPCCNLCSDAQNKVATACKAEMENSPKKQALLSVQIPGTKGNNGMFNDDPLQKHVSVGPLFQAEVPEWTGMVAESDSKWQGPLFQAEVPEWTGMVAESDSKWQGTRTWPPENGKHNSLMEMDPIGKGRQDSCSCRLPGSVQCVRFHIAEKRMKLKLELGSLFYYWRFDRMGEEVSLSWTNEEEKRFKDMVRLKPPSLNKCFWDDAFKFFPAKTREKLVSYYFNVFLVLRRRYQNQVTPKHIDSDDDESEFGRLGDSYGHEALNVPGSELLVCAENKQCIDV